MSRRIFCKFFANGACLKGEHCKFSHDWNDSPGPSRETVFNNVCTFYQKGVCSYGTRCRFAHIKIQSAPSPSSSNSVSPTTSDSVQDASLSGVPSNVECLSALSSATELSDPSKAFLPPSTAAGTRSNDTCSHLDRIGRHPTPISLAERPICSFAIDGNCPHGENCPKIHGDMCFLCGKYCLHPYRPVEREEHIKFCEKNINKRLEILKQSEEIECSVCLECVLSKATPSERRFGLLSECDHPFCISCIRNWRSNSPSSGMDVNTALRACPVCRKRSYFVIPSDIWYSTKEEKQEIINSYKAKLRSIDCKYFNFGHGKCPFGTSCFYKHTYSAVGRNLYMYCPVHILEEEEEVMFQQFLGETLVPVHVLEEEEELMYEQFLGETLALADFIEQTGNELEDSDDELEMAYMLMQMGLDASDSSNEDDTKSP